jgi:hypothetical protein
LGFVGGLDGLRTSRKMENKRKNKREEKFHYFFLIENWTKRDYLATLPVN